MEVKSVGLGRNKEAENRVLHVSGGTLGSGDLFHSQGTESKFRISGLARWLFGQGCLQLSLATRV